MKTQSTENNTTNKKRVGALDEDSPKSGADTRQGKKLENPTQKSHEDTQGLVEDLGARKDKDYPGPDEGITGEKPGEKQAAQSKGVGEREASGKAKDVEGDTEESLLDEDEEEDNSKTNNRSWQAGSNAPQQAKSPDRNER